MKNITNTLEKTRGLSRFFDIAVEGLFSPECVHCGNERDAKGTFLCSPCRGAIRYIRDPLCDFCGQPGEIDYPYPHDEFVCGLCQVQPYAFKRARSLGHYETALKSLIRTLKYREQTGVIGEIRPLLQAWFQGAGEDYRGYTVVQAPLHSDKMKERGFDQTYLIAREAARALSVPLQADCLIRVRATPPQAGLERSQRAANVKNAFAVTSPEQVAGKNILLVDDVFTTGSTINEAAKVLKRSGAGRVEVFTLARATKGRFTF